VKHLHAQHVQEVHTLIVNLLIVLYALQAQKVHRIKVNVLIVLQDIFLMKAQVYALFVHMELIQKQVLQNVNVANLDPNHIKTKIDVNSALLIIIPKKIL